MNETWETANHIKFWEFAKHLQKYQGSRFPKYKFVSKVDDDSFINLPVFYKEFMAPYLEQGKNSSHTLIGRKYDWFGGFEWVHGRFYTVSWDLMEIYARLHAENPYTDQNEDSLTGRYLFEHDIPYTIIEIPRNRSENTIETVNGEPPGFIAEDTVVVHYLKTNQRFLEIAALFNETGYNGKYLEGVTLPRDDLGEPDAFDEPRVPEVPSEAAVPDEP